MDKGQLTMDNDSVLIGTGKENGLQSLLFDKLLIFLIIMERK